MSELKAKLLSADELAKIERDTREIARRYTLRTAESDVLRLLDHIAALSTRPALSPSVGEAAIMKRMGQTMEGIVYFGDALAYNNSTLGIELRKWIAAGAADLAALASIKEME